MVKDITRYIYYGARDEAATAANKASCAIWRIANPGKTKTINTKSSIERHRKGGKFYEKTLKDKRTGIPGKKNRIRTKHCILYRPFKRLIAPGIQIHHQWIPNTAKYTGIALVETDLHRFGIIKPIVILEGKITLMREKEVSEQ